MNGFAALDIHPHRRYVVDIGGRRSSRCRLHINFALFLHSLDFTQNLGVTHKPAEVVKAQLMKLNGDHLRFVLICLKENTTQVRNIRQYLLATLYNAPMTMHSSYAARVQHDFKTG